jgi:uncharacterized protein
MSDLDEKMVFVTGARQTGKTTLSKMLYERYDYLNQDVAADRLNINSMSWDRRRDLIIFDELHKKRGWKSWLKGVFDSEGVRPRLLVTGSAKLDTYRKVGDSLAGRFLSHRLHPLDVKELREQSPPAETLDRLMRIGGFPEPFLKGSEQYYKRWRRSHLDIILRQDILDLEVVRDIQSIETLVELLRHRVGSPVSFSSLARDLERDAKTVKRWLAILETLYVVFRVAPYHKNIARSLLKEPRYYFYDTGQVCDDQGARLENLVAAALRKELDRVEDSFGDTTDLHYLRTKDGNEIDFLVLVSGKPRALIEVKSSDSAPSRHFGRFAPVFPGADQVQLVRELARETSYPSGVAVRRAADWLAEVDFAAGAV